MSSGFCTVLDIPSTPNWYNTVPMMKNYIKEIRQAKGYTQEYLAEIMGVTHATVQRHENGKRQPNLETIHRYARALGCHPSDLTEGPGTAPPPLSDSERELLESFRQLDDGAQSMYLHTLKSFSTAPEEKQKPEPEEKGRKIK